MYGKTITNNRADSRKGTAIASMKQTSPPLPKCIISCLRCPECPGFPGNNLNIK